MMLQGDRHGEFVGTTSKRVFLYPNIGAVASLLFAIGCSNGSPGPSQFSTVDGSITDSSNNYDEVSCDNPPLPIYCSSTKGPVESIDAAGGVVTVECTSDYPSCLPPKDTGSDKWLCCLNCEVPPLFTCLAPASNEQQDAAVDATDSSTIDGPHE